MVLHKNFESNSKRLAKAIMREAFSSPTSDAILFGNCIVEVSSEMMRNITKKNEREYINAINEYLGGCKITKIGKSFEGGMYLLTFEIET